MAPLTPVAPPDAVETSTFPLPAEAAPAPLFSNTLPPRAVEDDPPVRLTEEPTALIELPTVIAILPAAPDVTAPEPIITLPEGPAFELAPVLIRSSPDVDAEAAVAKVRLPLAEVVPAPVVREIAPPVTPLPAATVTEPPAAAVDAPAEIAIAPPPPEVAPPVERVKAPPAPAPAEVEDPVLMLTDPALPVACPVDKAKLPLLLVAAVAAEVVIVTSPEVDEAAVVTPDLIATAPPVFSPGPEDNVIAPPVPEAEAPTVRLIAPACPLEEAPDCIVMPPLDPVTVVPEVILMAPLTPVAPPDAVETSTFPLPAEAAPAPLFSNTLPPRAVEDDPPVRLTGEPILVDDVPADSIIEPATLAPPVRSKMFPVTPEANVDAPVVTSTFPEDCVAVLAL
jgi:hypothetical protein